METTSKTMAERADEFGEGTWEACWDLERMAERLTGLWNAGNRIGCDETFDGTMPDELRSISDYLTAIENARQAVRLAHHIIAGLGD